MTTRSLKRTAFLLLAVVVLALLFWPLPAQFKFIGTPFLTFALALYVALRIWRSSPRGKWLLEFQRHHKLSWTVYFVILATAAALTYITLSFLSYWPRAVIEFLLVIAILLYGLRELKRFLI